MATLHERRIAVQLRRFFADEKDLAEFETQLAGLITARAGLEAAQERGDIRLLAIEFARCELALFDLEETLLQEIIAAHTVPVEKIRKELGSAHAFRQELKQPVEAVQDSAVARREGGVKLPLAARIQVAKDQGEAKRTYVAGMKATNETFQGLRDRSTKIRQDVAQLKLSLRALKGRRSITYKPPQGLAYGEAPTEMERREHFAETYLAHKDWRKHDAEFIAERVATAKADGGQALAGLEAAVAMADSFERKPRK